jgi:hypothetical protein
MIWHMTMRQWDEDNGKYFKGVYRWDITGDPVLSEMNPDNGEITN